MARGLNNGVAKDDSILDTAGVRVTLEATGASPDDAKRAIHDMAMGGAKGIVDSARPLDYLTGLLSGLDDRGMQASVCALAVEAAGKSPSPEIIQAFQGCGVSLPWIAAASKKGSLPSWLPLDDSTKDLVSAIRMTLSDQEWRVAKGVEALEEALPAHDALDALARVANLPSIQNGDASRGNAMVALLSSPKAQRDHVLSVWHAIEKHTQEKSMRLRLGEGVQLKVAALLAKSPKLDAEELVGMATFDWKGQYVITDALMERGTPDIIAVALPIAMSDRPGCRHWANAFANTGERHLDIMADIAGAPDVLARRYSQAFFSKRLENDPVDPLANEVLVQSLEDTGFMEAWSNDAPNCVLAANALAHSASPMALAAMADKVAKVLADPFFGDWEHRHLVQMADALAEALGGEAWRKNPGALPPLLALLSCGVCARTTLASLVCRDEPAALDAAIGWASEQPESCDRPTMGVFLMHSALANNPKYLVPMMCGPMGERTVSEYHKDFGASALATTIDRLVAASGSVGKAMSNINKILQAGALPLQVARALPDGPERAGLLINALDAAMTAPPDREYFRPTAKTVAGILGLMEGMAMTPALVAACAKVCETIPQRRGAWVFEPTGKPSRGSVGYVDDSLPGPVKQAIRLLVGTDLPEAHDVLMGIVNPNGWDKAIADVSGHLDKMPNVDQARDIAQAVLDLALDKSKDVYERISSYVLDSSKKDAANFLAPKISKAEEMGAGSSVGDYLGWKASEHPLIRQRFCQEAPNWAEGMGQDVLVGHLEGMLRDVDEDVARAALKAIRRIEGLPTKDRFGE